MGAYQFTPVKGMENARNLRASHLIENGNLTR